MCDKCGQTFYHNSNLKKHQETAHPKGQLVAGQASVYPILGHPADMVHSFILSNIPPLSSFCATFVTLF